MHITLSCGIADFTVVNDANYEIDEFGISINTDSGFLFIPNKQIFVYSWNHEYECFEIFLNCSLEKFNLIKEFIESGCI